MSIRIAASSDWHLGLTRYSQPGQPGSRLDDFIATLGRFTAQAADEAHLAVFAGDTFDTRNAGPREQAAFALAVGRLAEAEIPVVVLPGNHDGMTTIGDPNTHALNWLANLRRPNVHVLTAPGMTEIGTAAGPVEVVAIPYPHKRALDLDMPGASALDRTEEASRRVEALVSGFAEAKRQRDVPRICVGHLSVVGGQLGSERAMRFGWDVTVRAEVFEPYDLTILGHLHPQQQIGPRAWYCGSPEYVDFAEVGQRKGWLMADVAPGLADVTTVQGGARLLGVHELQQAPDGHLPDTGPAAWYAGGPIIRVRITAHQRVTASEKARIQRELYDKGASYVELEVNEPSRANARPDADAGQLLEPVAALRQWLTLTGKPVEPALTVGTELIAAETA